MIRDFRPGGRRGRWWLAGGIAIVLLLGGTAVVLSTVSFGAPPRPKIQLAKVGDAGENDRFEAASEVVKKLPSAPGSTLLPAVAKQGLSALVPAGSVVALVPSTWNRAGRIAIVSARVTFGPVTRLVRVVLVVTSDGWRVLDMVDLGVAPPPAPAPSSSPSPGAQPAPRPPATNAPAPPAPKPPPASQPVAPPPSSAAGPPSTAVPATPEPSLSPSKCAGLSASSPKVDPKAVPVILVPGPDGVAGLQATTEVAGLAGTVPAGGSLVARMAEIPGVAPYVLTAGDPSHWVGDDDGTGPALADAIDCLRTGGRKVAVVAVSTGGLAARWAFSKADDAAARAGATALVTTLGTPFDGSYAIGLAKTLGADNPPFVPNALDNPRRASLVLQAALADLATCPAAGGEEQHVKPACRRLDVLAALAGPLAEALTPGSTQLRSLPAWPRGVPVLQLAGHALVSDGKQRVDIGDGIASTASALAGAPRGAVHSCPTATAGGAGPLSCWNSDLPVLTEAVDDAVGAVRAVAHPTVTGFFGEGGSGVVEDGRILSQLPIRPEHTGFTADGRYFVVLGNSKLTVLDIDTQVVRDVSCDCFGFAIVGRQVYVDTYSGPMVAFGVPDLRSRPVPVAGVGQATYVQPIGASGEKLILEVLRNAGAANGQPAVLTVAPDGARSTEVPLPAPSATYQVYPTSPTTAVALNSSHASACSYYDMASTVDFRTGKSAYIDGTAFAGIGPSLGPEPPVGVDYVSLTDLHRGRDGKMYVTARSGRCDDQQIQTDTIQPSLFRLDGTRWVRAAAGTIGPTRDFGAAGRWSLSGLVGGGGGQRLSWSHAGTVSYPREGVDSLVSPPAQDVL